MIQPPGRITLDGGTCLRIVTVDDAHAIARAVGESLDHLTPWMPWAGPESADPDFQRRRIAKLPALARRGDEWQYALFDGDGRRRSRFLGSFGLMTRRGPGTLEIGYWLHVDAVGCGHATRAAAALTEVARHTPGIRRVYIVCDEANTASAAVPRRLGYTLRRTERRTPESPAETGRMQLWTIDSSDPAPPSTRSHQR